MPQRHAKAPIHRCDLRCALAWVVPHVRRAVFVVSLLAGRRLPRDSVRARASPLAVTPAGLTIAPTTPVPGPGTMSAIDIHVGQLGIRYLIDGSRTARMGMFELTVPPASNVPPPHSHSGNEEIVYVLEGILRYSVASETRDLSAGQSMHTPRGIVHAFSNPSASVARALIILSPDIGARYFQDVAAVLNAGGPPDAAAVAAVMARYGLVASAQQ